MSDIDKEIDEMLKEEDLSSVDSEIDSALAELAPKEPTFEDKYLQPIYNVGGPLLKGLSVMGKPLSTAGAAGRTVGNLLVGQDDPAAPLKAEWESFPFPSAEGNPLAGLETIDGMGDPLIQSPDSLKENAPKLASFVEQSSTPANLAQEIVDKLLGVTSGSSYKKVFRI